MNLILSYLNPFTPISNKKVKTPWGNIKPKVDMFPIIYLIFIYGIVYILPFGENLIGMSWFEWCRSEDGPIEWIQLFLYLGAGLFAMSSLIKRVKYGLTLNLIIWGLILFLCIVVAGAEINWGERITRYGIESIRNINYQNEYNLHNFHYIHLLLLDPSFEISCILFGFIGWKYFPKLDALPSKKYSLYFLFVALFHLYFNLSFYSDLQQIRNDQEVFELLMALGLFLHCKDNSIIRLNKK